MLAGLSCPVPVRQTATEVVARPCLPLNSTRGRQPAQVESRREDGTKSKETAQEFNAAARAPTTNRTKQWVGGTGRQAGGRASKQASMEEGRRQGVVWRQGSHLGEELLRLELGVSERPGARAAAAGQRRAVAKPRIGMWMRMHPPKSKNKLLKSDFDPVCTPLGQYAAPPTAQLKQQAQLT
jgi:hypothetical protein